MCKSLLCHPFYELYSGDLEESNEMVGTGIY